MAYPSQNLELPSASAHDAPLRALLAVMPLPAALVRCDGVLVARNELFLEAATTVDATAPAIVIQEVFAGTDCHALLKVAEGSGFRYWRPAVGEARPRCFAWSSHVWPEDQKLILVTGIDVTREAELENYITENQWFETAAALSGGLAHDFNNALAGILGLSEIVSLRLPKGSPLQNFTTRIAASVDRAKIIVRRFSQFSRKSTGTIDPQPTAMLVDDLVLLLKAFMPSSVALSAEIDPETPWCSAGRHEFEHILLNCCTFFRSRLRDDGGTLQVVCGPGESAKTSEIRLTASGRGLEGVSIESAFELDLKPSSTAYESGAGLFTAFKIARTGNCRLSLRRDDPRTLAFMLELPPAL